MAISSSNVTTVLRPRGLVPMRALSRWFRVRRLADGRVNHGVRRMWAARVSFYQAMWRNACATTATTIVVGSTGGIEMWRGGRCLKARDNETYVDDPAAIKRAGDKLLVHRLLTQAGIPVPRHLVVGIEEFDRAFSCLQSIGAPLVVKPMAFTGGGCGVTTNVFTAGQLKSALAWSRTFGNDILIEEQIEGDCYRILIMDGKHVDSILRHPPTIVGDGRSTIRQLLREENKRRIKQGASRSQVLIAIDRDLVNTLARQGLKLGSRPSPGSVVRLKQVVNENALHENSPAAGLLCADIIASAQKAAALVGLRLAGVDVICRDPSAPLEASNGVVLEVNAPPNLYYHHLERRTSSVATEILTAFFDDQRDDLARAGDAVGPNAHAATLETQSEETGSAEYQLDNQEA
jgi:D-alanine-D-alanine ligase-like ATP-grasp enzyme